MKDSMIPYMMLREEKGLEQDTLIVELVEHSEYIFIDEHYCCNPACNCNTVLLTFHEITKDGKVQRELLNLAVDLDTWKGSRKNIIVKEKKYKEMLQVFMKQSDKYKERFKLHYSEIKEYGKSNVSDYVSDGLKDLIMQDGLIAYSEVFGSENVKEFSFEYNNIDKYSVVDQYCVNPKCLCNEVVLSFIKVDLKRKVQDFEFVVVLDLKKLKYKIKERKDIYFDPEKVINYFIESKPETMKIIKSRYSKMKKVGKEVIEKNNKNQMKNAPINVVIGRNDLCPCGSGKKYKRCCG